MHNDSVIQPISSLNPYQQNWKIKARCTNKDKMRAWKNHKGEGKLFGVDLLDNQGSQIRAIAFNETAVDLYDKFERNKVYLISGGRIRLARKGYCAIKNDYAITLNSTSKVVPVSSDNNDIKQQQYSFKKIKFIETLPGKSFVDIIGVLIEFGSVTELISKKNQESIKKRSLVVADSTGKIMVTLWGEEADNFDETECKMSRWPVIALKGCKVSEYGGVLYSD